MPSSKPLLAAFAATALVGGAGGAAVTATTSPSKTTTVTQVASSPATRAVADTTSSASSSARAIYARSKAAVATITAQVTETTTGAFGQAQPSSGTATGTGFVVSPDGYVVTNDHVVDGASSVQVSLDGGAKQTARVVGTDASTDLALLRVDPGDREG